MPLSVDMARWIPGFADNTLPPAQTGSLRLVSMDVEHIDVSGMAAHLAAQVLPSIL
jgi:hypothetical protein